jgi:hypothetical protein
MSRTRSSTRQNSYGPLSIVTERVLSGSPVSRNRTRNAITVASIRRLILSNANLYRQYGHIFRALHPSPRVINLHARSNIGRRFQTILRHARITTRHRDRSVSFHLPNLPRYGVPAGIYRLHPNGSIAGPGGFAARFTAGQRGFMLANVNT